MSTVENDELVYKIQVRDYYIWSTQYKTTSIKRAESLYRKILRARNITKG